MGGICLRLNAPVYTTGYLAPSPTSNARTEHHRTLTLGDHSNIGRPDALLSLEYPVPLFSCALILSRRVPVLTHLQTARTSTCAPYPSLDIQRKNGALLVVFYSLDVY